MADLDGQGAGHEFVVGCLVHGSFFFFIGHAVLEKNAGVGSHQEVVVEGTLVIDFVEGHPVLDLVLVALEADFSEADEEVDGLAVGKAAIILGQVEGHFEVAQGDYWLNAILVHFVKQVVVEFQACFAWLLVVAIREDSGPGNRSSEGLKAHPGQQFDVFFVVVVEVDG